MIICLINDGSPHTVPDAASYRHRTRGMCVRHYSAWLHAGMPEVFCGMRVPAPTLSGRRLDILDFMAAAGVRKAELVEHLAGCGAHPDFVGLIARAKARR